MKTGNIALIRRVVARFMAPSGGFPARLYKAAEKWNKEIEKRGHDIQKWKNLSEDDGDPDFDPNYGWSSKCVRCNIEFVIMRSKSRYALYSEAGYTLNTQVPSLSAREWETHTCTVEPKDVIRGMFVLTDDPATLLTEPKASVAATLLKIITARPLGNYWTHADNRPIVENYARGAEDGRAPVPKGQRGGVPVILHAQFRRDDQPRNFKNTGGGILPEYEFESEIWYKDGVILRLQTVEWFDGQGWVKQTTNMKVRT